MAERLSNPVAQFLDSSGDPIPGGKLHFFNTGTTTNKDTFADINLKIQNANPVIIEDDGRIPNIFLDGAYKIQLLDQNDQQIWERDPVGGTTTAQFSDFNSATIYSIPDIVRGSDNKFYESIVNNNQNSDPTTTPAAWTELILLKVWNPSEIYGVGALVRGSDNNQYNSLVASNSGNDPISSPTQWEISGTLNRKIIEIGDWNMDSLASVQVTHGLTVSKIRSISAIIRHDTDNVVDPAGGLQSTGFVDFGIGLVGFSTITLERRTGGFFDSTDYDSTSFNRGWIVVDFLN